MGVAEVLGKNPVTFARDLLGDSEEIARRTTFRRRRLLYQDNGASVINTEIARIFRNETVQAKLKAFTGVGAWQALVKRVVDEISRPVYAVPPRRIVEPDITDEAGRSGFGLLAEECGLNQVMDTACRVVNAANHAFIYTRYVPRLERVVCHVLWPDAVTVVPDPDDDCCALAYIYDKRVFINGRWETWHVYWDDRYRFQMDHRQQVVSFMPGGPPIEEHGMEIMPWVSVRLKGPTGGGFWDETSGRALESAQIACNILGNLALRHLKTKGFNVPFIQGDLDGFPKGQILDEENAVVANKDVSVTQFQGQSDAKHYIDLIDSIKSDAAANKGLSRARMNQMGAQDSDDTGLMEQRAEAVKVMDHAERCQFEVLKIVSMEHAEPAKRLSPEAMLRLDFGEFQHRVDRQTQLAIRETERHMGLRNVLDDVMEDNPEIQTPEEAEQFLEHNIEVTSKWVERMRALNQAKSSNADQPGQGAQDNGAMGPRVRDGKMTKDEAAMMAKQGGMDVKDDDKKG